MTRKKKRRSAGGKKGTRVWAYPTEFRVKVVRLFMEEGYSASLLAEQFGISRSAIRRWIRLYRLRGAKGLESKPLSGGKPNVSPEVRERMVAVMLLCRANERNLSSVNARLSSWSSMIRPESDCFCKERENVLG